MIKTFCDKCDKEIEANKTEVLMKYTVTDPKAVGKTGRMHLHGSCWAELFKD